MSPNTWQVKTRMPKACSAPVCFRKTVTAEVASAAALVSNGVTLFSPVWKVKCNLRYVLVAKKKKIKVLFSGCCNSYFRLYIYIKIHENPLFQNWQMETNCTTFICHYFVQIVEATGTQTHPKDLRETNLIIVIINKTVTTRIIITKLTHILANVWSLPAHIS
jgi:hypothetical protein